MKKILLILSMLIISCDKTEHNYPYAWSKDGHVLHPQCFKNYWDDGDNYQEFYEQFTGIKKDYFTTKEFDDFTLNIGKYWGKEITTYEPIKFWNEDLELAVSMQSCLNKKTSKFEVNEDEVTSSDGEPYKGIDGGLYYENEYLYKVLKKITLETCDALAPNVDGKCMESNLLKIGDWGGGSKGHSYEWSIFGLFQLSNGDKYILPLKRFESEKEAMAYEEIN